MIYTLTQVPPLGWRIFSLASQGRFERTLASIVRELEENEICLYSEFEAALESMAYLKIVEPTYWDDPILKERGALNPDESRSAKPIFTIFGTLKPTILGHICFEFFEEAD